MSPVNSIRPWSLSSIITSELLSSLSMNFEAGASTRSVVPLLPRASVSPRRSHPTSWSRTSAAWTIGCFFSFTSMNMAEAYQLSTGMSLCASHSRPPPWSSSVWVRNTASRRSTPSFARAVLIRPMTQGLPVSIRPTQSPAFSTSASPLPTLTANICTADPPVSAEQPPSSAPTSSSDST